MGDAVFVTYADAPGLSSYLGANQTGVCLKMVSNGRKLLIAAGNKGKSPCED